MSFVFPGTAGDYLSVVSDLITANNYTVFFYYKETGNVGSFRTMFNYDNTASHYVRCRIRSSNVVEAQANQGVQEEVQSSSTMPSATWTPIVFGSDGVDKIRFQALGESGTSGPHGTWQTNSGAELTLGTSIDGKLAHIAIWSRELNTTERSNLLAGTDPATITTGLVELWDGSSLTGTNSTVLVQTGSVTINDSDDPLAAALAIDSSPSETRATVQASFTVSNPATVPTTLNTTIALEAGGPSVAPDSVTGSDPYTINYTFPKTTNKLFSNTGYVHRITIDAETVDSSAIPYLPETNWAFVTIGTPDTGTDIYTEYAGGTWSTNDQCVYDTVTDPGGNVVTIDNTLNWNIIPAPITTQTVSVYRIAADNTKDIDDTINFEDTITMAIDFIASLRNNMLDEVTALIDAGAGPGKIKIYDGTKPAVGAAITTQTLLAQPTFSATSFPAASGGSMTANAITSDPSAAATGIATWFRCTDSNDNAVIDGDIADLNLNTNNITAGLEVAITSAVITAGNS